MRFRDFLSKGVAFALIGGIGAVVNWGILFGLVSFGQVWYLEAEIIATFIAFGVNYLGNIVNGNIKFDTYTIDEVRKALVENGVSLTDSVHVCSTLEGGK